jgi:hypothetical protein
MNLKYYITNTSVPIMYGTLYLAWNNHMQPEHEDDQPSPPDVNYAVSCLTKYWNNSTFTSIVPQPK